MHRIPVQYNYSFAAAQLHVLVPQQDLHHAVRWELKNVNMCTVYTFHLFMQDIINYKKLVNIYLIVSVSSCY